jgi:hypothetical protein
MTLGLLFWILMLLWLVGYGWGTFHGPAGQPVSWPTVGPNILLFILLLILGWKVFGSPIQ